MIESSSLEVLHEQALSRAREARATLTQEIEEAYLQRKPARKLSDPHVARLTHIATLYQDILEHPEQGEDHHLWEEPFFGTLSTLDLVHLLEGDERHAPGLATLDHEGYGIVVPTPSGWSLHLDGDQFSLTGEMAHRLLVENTESQPAPYISPGVLPTREWRAFYDGMTVVVPPRSLQTKDGESFEIVAPIRLSLPYCRYAALVWSVVHAKYEGMEQFEFHGEVTRECFGEQRVPENMLEARFWYDNLTWRGYSEEDQKRCFLPGRIFSHLTREAMGNFEVYKRLQAKVEAQRGEGDSRI